MGVLEQIEDMKRQGISDEDIINSLQEQGISPRQINDALSQSEIKNAVSEEEFYPEVPTPQEESSDTYLPQTREIGESPASYQSYPQQTQYQEYSQEPYSQQDYSYQGSSTDNTIEIAEQVFQEKVKTLQKQLDKLNEFQTLAQTKIENVSERLKRIELSFDKLQLSILDRVGSYGRNIDSMKKEIEMVEDSFSKLSPTHHLEHKTPATHKTTKKRTRKKRK